MILNKINIRCKSNSKQFRIISELYNDLFTSNTYYCFAVIATFDTLKEK